MSFSTVVEENKHAFLQIRFTTDDHAVDPRRYESVYETLVKSALRNSKESLIEP